MVRIATVGGWAEETSRLSSRTSTPGGTNGSPTSIYAAWPAAACDPSRQQPRGDLHRRRRLSTLSVRPRDRLRALRVRRSRLRADDESLSPAHDGLGRGCGRKNDAVSRSALCRILQSKASPHWNALEGSL